MLSVEENTLKKRAIPAKPLERDLQLWSAKGADFKLTY